jgi:DNA-binding CsgD family transcriptional regulator
LFANTATKVIQETCDSLHPHGLTNFMHDITFTKGQISMLVSDERVFSFYYQNNIPTLCTDETGRTLAAGVYLNKTLENSRQDCAILMPLLVNVGKRLGQNYGRNSVHVVTRETDCQHLYSLFFDLDENDFLHWIVNNGNFLQDFIHQYNFSAQDLITEAKAEENRIVLPTFKDFAAAMHLKVTADTTPVNVIHKSLHMPVHLSSQHAKCLLLLIQGKSAKEIARNMQLSHRTVEHYIEKIRRQLGCSSTKELIAAYSDQLSSFTNSAHTTTAGKVEKQGGKTGYEAAAGGP